MTRPTLTVLFALSLVTALSACGLKGDLYLPSPDAANQPKKKTATTAAAKAGDDNKAAQGKSQETNP